MKFFAILFLIAILVFLGVQGYHLYRQRADLMSQQTVLEAERLKFEAENAQLARDIEYYQNVENAAKESRTQFNYKKSDEKLFILVASSSSQ